MLLGSRGVFHIAGIKLDNLSPQELSSRNTPDLSSNWTSLSLGLSYLVNRGIILWGLSHKPHSTHKTFTSVDYTSTTPNEMYPTVLYSFAFCDLGVLSRHMSFNGALLLMGTFQITLLKTLITSLAECLMN